MASRSFIVREKGLSASIDPASHGADRLMSRTRAGQMLQHKVVSDRLKEAVVELIGSGSDEAPLVYKDIHKVMTAQKDLIEVLGSFMPEIVRMCGEEKIKEADLLECKFIICFSSLYFVFKKDK